MAASHAKDILEIDGAQGEGGGQVLRTALTLSMISGTPIRISNIRAGRSKPGLLRQHLTAVLAAQSVSGAEVRGAEAGSRELWFTPGKIAGGQHEFAIGTAGSCTLVLQTILPALWFADAESTVRVSGGTHNPFAPPADFLIQAWLPLMRTMGVDMDIELLRHGFYPAGGGEIEARVHPAGQLKPLTLENRVGTVRETAYAIVAAVPQDVATRELERLVARLGPIPCETRSLPSREGPGNALMVRLDSGNVTEVFTTFGERGVSAAKVADLLASAVLEYRASSAAVGEHLADQLVLALALAGAGSFTTMRFSSHLRTNISVVEKFLSVAFDVTQHDQGHFRVSAAERSAGAAR